MRSFRQAALLWGIPLLLSPAPLSAAGGVKELSVLNLNLGAGAATMSGVEETLPPLESLPMSLPAPAQSEEIAVAARGRFGAHQGNLEEIDNRIAVAEQLFKHRGRENDLEAVQRLSRFVFGEASLSSPELKNLRPVINEALDASRSNGILKRLRLETVLHSEMGLTSMDIYGPPKPKSFLKRFLGKESAQAAPQTAPEFNDAASLARDLRRIRSFKQRRAHLKKALGEGTAITWDEALVLLTAFKPEEQKKAYKTIIPYIATPLKMYSAEGKNEIEAAAQKLSSRSPKEISLTTVPTLLETAQKKLADGKAAVANAIKGRGRQIKRAAVAGSIALVLSPVAIHAAHRYEAYKTAATAQAEAAAAVQAQTTVLQAQAMAAQEAYILQAREKSKAYRLPDGTSIDRKLAIIRGMQTIESRLAIISEIANSDDALKTMRPEHILELKRAARDGLPPGVLRLISYNEEWRKYVDKDLDYLVVRYVKFHKDLDASFIHTISAADRYGDDGYNSALRDLLFRGQPTP